MRGLYLITNDDPIQLLLEKIRRRTRNPSNRNFTVPP